MKINQNFFFHFIVILLCIVSITAIGSPQFYTSEEYVNKLVCNGNVDYVRFERCQRICTSCTKLTYVCPPHSWYNGHGCEIMCPAGTIWFNNQCQIVTCDYSWLRPCNTY